MNILFLTMSAGALKIEEHSIYNDLIWHFINKGHEVYVVSPRERRLGIETNLTETNGIHNLGVRTLNVQKTNVIEKGIGQVLIEPLFQRAIKKYFGQVKFDLILYSTPPITFVNAIKWAKKHNPGAVSYLMLKDIFPQNAIDIGMLSKSGPKGILYKSFRRKEKQLYKVSDWIGCMSPANVKYVLDNNPEVAVREAQAPVVEICPNSFALVEMPQQTEETRASIRQKYGLPADKPIFFYGGNLGKPQGIPFLIDCLNANANRKDCHFLIVGNGFDYPKIQSWYEETHPQSVTLLQSLPKEDYDQLACSCDVGLIFLDYRFTIPNYPSRLLNCLMQKKPIIACTDPNCDTGTIAEENGYGYWCPSNSVEAFTLSVDKMLASDIKKMGEAGYQYFLDNYTVEHTYKAIMQHLV